MITKTDCLLLLGELAENGVDTSKIYPVALNYNGVNPQVVKFINSHRRFEANKFYEKLRTSYNQKRSKLYINIVKETLDDPNEALIILSSLNLQILLFAEKVEERDFFLKQARFKEICKVLDEYSETYNLVPCIKLLKLIKADLKAFEYFSKTSTEEL